jgi:hypothetical protein
LLHLDIKDPLTKDARFFDGGWIDWWVAYKNDAAGGLLSYAKE